MKYYLFLLAFLLISPFLRADRVSSAYKQIQKGDFEKARDLLNKEIEKDSLSAGAYHIYAVYFFSENNPAYQIDSAYAFINQALEFYNQVEEKTLENWAKDGISYEAGEKLKANIEAKAFNNAQKEDNPEAYQSFLDRFPQAPQIDKAREARNARAWEKTIDKNTIDSYVTFISTYPQANQVKEAVKRRDRFILERETRSGRLSDFEKFVKNYPKNSYLNEAIAQIYRLSTLMHREEDYQRFVQKYPKHPKANQAWDFLLMTYLARQDLSTFSQKYRNYYDQKKLRELLNIEGKQYVSYIDDELFGLIDEEGNKRIPARYDYLASDYLCESVVDNFVIINKNGLLGIIDRLGNEIVPPQFDKIDQLAPGLFIVTKNAFQGLIDHTGSSLSEVKYDAIEKLNDYYIKARKGRRWALLSYSGEVLLPAEYNQINAFGRKLLALKQDNNYCLESVESLKELACEKNRSMDFEFDEIQAFGDDYVLTRRGQKFGLTRQDGRHIFQLDKDEIRILNKVGFAARQGETWEIYREAQSSYLDLPYSRFIYSEDLFAGTVDDKWGAIDMKGQVVLEANYDSLVIIKDALLILEGRKKKVVFGGKAGGKEVDFSYFRNIRAEKGNYPDARTFVYYEDRLGKKGLFNLKGEKALSPKYQNVYTLDDDLINVQLYGKYGLVDSLRQLVLPLRYQGITSFEEDPAYKILLLNQKFGVYSKSKKVRIEPQFDERPRVFTRNEAGEIAFLVRKKGKYGLINRKNKLIIPYSYARIEYWQDSLALVQKTDDHWTFYDFSKSKSSPEAFSKADYEALAVLFDKDKSKVVAYKKDGKYGLISNEQGILARPQFDRIENRGSAEAPLFFAENRLPNNQYEVFYLNQKGKIIWQKKIPSLDYNKLFCE